MIVKGLLLSISYEKYKLIKNNRFNFMRINFFRVVASLITFKIVTGLEDYVR
jgi:hypothetical protein